MSRSWGLNELSASLGAAFGDLDRDGDLDLIVSQFDEPVSVYRNASTGGHRVLVRLRGTHSNTWGIGAKVTITTAVGSQTRTLSLASGMMSANEPLLHFGLGTEQRIQQLQIDWPSGHRQTLNGLMADRFYTITESAEPIRPQTALPPSPRFVQVHQAAKLIQPEQDFDDFAREPSLPWKLSQLGPGLALADVDGDGDLDLYQGGPASRSGMLCLNDGQGRFQPMSNAAFDADRAAEDMGPLFFDADGDGDADLYVVSGGVECGPGDSRLRDRLYLNDGHGHFIRASGDVLPDLRDSGSGVTAADFDRDGDLDLLVGSRCIPGRYPETPISRLLRNDAGRFADVTESNAPALQTIGLVTSAIWSDANDDGWPDLLITREWNSVALILNERGRLVDRTVESGLAHRTGWWNGIAACDFDGDGDLDYVITNLGLNTPYRASEAAPCVAYLVPGADPMRLVEACFDHDKLVPVRRREWFLEAWPALVERFPTYRSFASASLAEILTEETLRQSHRLNVTTLESGILENDGQAHFKFHPLPRLAQMAPAFGFGATDFDGDGRPDIYLAQNFFSPQPETGRMDGGLGQLLQGRGGGQFGLVEPAVSGLMVPGDGKSVAVGDLNGDGRPDLIVGVNNGELCVFTNATDRTVRVLSVQLKGKPGNATGIGARVSVTLSDGSRQTAEMQAGGGYLSQSNPCLYFGLGVSNQVARLSVRWPNGARTVLDHSGPGLSVLVAEKE